MADDENKKQEEKAAGILGETLKKVFTVGVSAAFMTEDAVRSYLSEMKLPKEILGTILQSAQKSKEEIVQRVTKEMITMVQKIDFAKELSKFAETHKFKVTAEFEMVKRDSKGTETET